MVIDTGLFLSICVQLAPKYLKPGTTVKLDMVE